MRQQGDPSFQSFLSRARKGAVTDADIALLNQRVIGVLPPPTGLSSVCINRRNDHGHSINRLQIVRFAEDRGQDIYVFPAKHARTHGNMTIDAILRGEDGDGDAEGPGLFLYTPNMPVVILYNISTPLGLVNGATGITKGIVPDVRSKIFS